jgi:eukaryotic-like serine/threonine-protein kinase
MGSKSSAPPKKRSQASRRVGQVIKARWHIDGLLGVGGMAAVYAATDLRGRRAALKILHGEGASDAAARERFLREGWVARSVQHACMVAVFDEGLTERGEPFLVMEQLEGRSVDRVVRKTSGRMVPPMALRIAERTLDLLAACHARGIIHRDIKPSNLFVTDAGHVKVLDFGVALTPDMAAERLPAGVVVGTPHYMAPEQAIGAWDQVDGRADLFAVGATIFHLVSGERLNNGRTEAESFQLAASSGASSLATAAPRSDPALVALVDRALAWDKSARFADAESMRQQVLEVLERIDDGTSELTARATKTRERGSLRAPSKHLPQSGRRGSTVPQPGAESMAVIPLAPSVPREFEVAGAEESGSRTARLLTEAFEVIEVLLASVIAHGYGHAELRSRLVQSHGLLSRALRAKGAALELNVFPFCITSGEVTIWEPAPPLDAVPHALYGAGVRALRLTPGIETEEVRELIEVLLPDAARVGAYEGDVLGLEQISHVELECVPMPMVGDGREREEFLHEAEHVEGVLREAIEQAAWDVGVASKEPAPQALRQGMRVNDWSRRCAHAMVEAFAVEGGPGSEAWLPLRASAAAGRGRGYQAIFLLQAHVREALQGRFGSSHDEGQMQALLAGVLGDEDLKALLQGASQLRADLLSGVQPWQEIKPDEVLAWVHLLLGALGPASFGTVLDSIPRLAEASIETAAALFVERHAEGREARIGLALPRVRVRVADRFMTILEELKKPEARKEISKLASGSSLTLRVLAAAHQPALGEGQRAEVLESLAHPEAEVRWAALRASDRHRLAEAAQTAVAQIASRKFHALSIDEREMLLTLVSTVDPELGEKLAIDIVLRHGLIGEQTMSESRVLAARLLGIRGISREALNALRGASIPLFWNPPAVRKAAGAAIAAIEARTRPDRGIA